MDAILKKKLQVPYYVSSEAKDLCNKVGYSFLCMLLVPDRVLTK